MTKSNLCLLAFTLIASFGLRPVTAQKPAFQNPVFQNPVLYEDLADLDILRVGDTFYYSASNMQYSPGAPILSSKDLVNWKYVGHSIPVLDFSPAYDLNGGNAYVKGSWASFLGYRNSNKTFYWGGCIEFKQTYIYTATAAEGPWKRHAVLPQCYYDAGLLVDDDDTMYVAYGAKTLHVAQLSPDGTREVKSQEVFTAPIGVDYIEGSRFYKINGSYYIFTTRPPNDEYVLKSTTGPFGPYTMQKLVINAKAPIPYGGGPHQGGIVETQKGDWYYMAFVDAYPNGRIPVLAPLTWDADGWPSLNLTDNTWPTALPYPLSPQDKTSHTGTDHFRGTTLSPEWEWNHNPDNAKWSLHNGLKLQTATVTNDIYAARNTLTHRILGPVSNATIELDLSHMKDGDRAGLALFRDSTAWIGIVRDNGSLRVAMEDNLTMDEHWKTTATGTEVASAPITAHKIWLRASADTTSNFRSGPDRTGTFAYSLDGKTFTPLGKPFAFTRDWHYFMGYRYAIFNYATQSLDGAVRVSSFTVAIP
ncbi:glycoside hydrolase family 43 protein [Granulicella aggregans]|jgi:beta-xylosidase|uniref:glycoside hydrolase family 43 protein n=1 Tax=Granulicella aggregans TaxID=474949 RepID=UPI0021DFAD95|nr:glycoside hydrolase 43 family protein [Granulicella aggregans]